MIGTHQGLGQGEGNGPGRIGPAGELLHQPLGLVMALVVGEAKAEAEFGVVFEQGIGPGGATAVVVGAPGGGRQAAAINRRAAGGIGHHHPITEELAGELDVRRFAAACAGAGELEQGLLQLLLVDVVGVEGKPIGIRQVEEKVPVAPLLVAQGPLRLHVDGLAAGFAPVAHRADLNAEAAAGAVFGGHLEGEALAGPVLIPRRGAQEAGGGSLQLLGLHHLGADHGMGADHHALAALHAHVWIPDRDGLGDVALLPAGRAAGKGAIHRQGTDRQPITLTGQLGCDHLADEGGCGGERIRHGRSHARGIEGASGDRAGCDRAGGDWDQPGQGGIHRLQVQRHHPLAFVGVAVADGAADGSEGLLQGQHRRQGEEAGLHDRVDPAPQPQLPGQG